MLSKLIQIVICLLWTWFNYSALYKNPIWWISDIKCVDMDGQADNNKNHNVKIICWMPRYFWNVRIKSNTLDRHLDLFFLNTWKNKTIGHKIDKTTIFICIWVWKKRRNIWKDKQNSGPKISFQLKNGDISSLHKGNIDF